MRFRIASTVAAAAIAIGAALAHATPAPLPSPDLSAHDFRNGSDAVAPSAVSVIGIGPGGAVFVSGPFTSVDGHSRPRGFARLTRHGSVDAAWAPALPEGTSLVAAEESQNGAVALVLNRGTVALVRPDAPTATILVPVSEGAVHALTFADDGTLYAAFTYKYATYQNPYAAVDARVEKVYPDGTLDPFFSVQLTGQIKPCYFIGSSARVLSLRLRDGFLYIGGDFVNAQAFATYGAARVSAATSVIDDSWRPLAGSYAPVAAQEGFEKATCGSTTAGTGIVLPGPDEFVYIGGYFDLNGHRNLRRFSKAGSGPMDATWLPGAPAGGIWRAVIDPRGNHLYVALDPGVVSFGGVSRRGLAAYSTSNSSIAPWDPDVGTNGYVGRLLALEDRLIVAGGFSSISATPRTNLAELPLADALTSGPSITVSPASIDFGTVIAGTVTERVVTVGNAGATPLSILSVELGDLYGFPGVTPLTVTNECTQPIAPGAACSLRVSLDPRIAFDTRLARLTIGSNGGSPQIVYMQWTPLAPEIVLYKGSGFSPAPTAALELGSAPVGSSRLETYRIYNQGNAPVTVTRFTVSGDGFTLSHDCPQLMPRYPGCNLTITFAPRTEGPAHGQLSLTLDTAARVYRSSGYEWVREYRRELSGNGGGPLDDSDGDGIPNGVETTLGRNPASKDNDIFASGVLFAMQQYRDFLGREGESAGISYWASQIENRLRTRAQVVQSFLESPEFQGVVAPVARLYFAYYLRIPDYDGLNFWVRRHQAGDSLAIISNNFAASTEFTIRYGSLDNGQFVDRIYQNVLGRAAEPAGRGFWVAELDSGRRTRGEVMLAFSEGPEYRQLSANEVYVFMTYLAMLKRAAEPYGFSFWVGYLDSGKTALALIEGFISSPEYRLRFLP